MLILHGGDGFLGRHISVAAHSRSVPFTVVSRSGNRDFLDTHAPSGQALSTEAFEGAEGDRLLERAEALAYLSWRTVPGTRLADPAEELELDVGPAWRTFERALTRRSGLRIVFLSSGGAIYGDTAHAAIAEDVPPAPVCAYGAAKLMAEQALRFSCARHGGVARILRPSNPIGRWHRRIDQGIVGVATRRLVQGEAVKVFGDGHAVRDYLSADDLADAVLSAALTPGSGGVWNVGSGEGRPVLDILDLVGAALGVKPRIEFAPDRGCDPARVVLDSSAFRAAFGWRPERDLAATVRESVMAIRSRIVERG